MLALDIFEMTQLVVYKFTKPDCNFKRSLVNARGPKFNRLL